MAAPQTYIIVVPSARHLHGKEAQPAPLVLQQYQSQQTSHFALTWGVKLTLAPRFSSNWATLRFS